MNSKPSFKRLFALLCLSLTSGFAAAQDHYRVAYSTKEDIGVFADNATEQNWCQEHLRLRFQAGEKATNEGLSILFPKIAKVIESTCPQATELEWTYKNAQQITLFSGKSSKNTSWAYQAEPVSVSNHEVTETTATLVEAPTEQQTEPQTQATVGDTNGVAVETAKEDNFLLYPLPSLEERQALFPKTHTLTNQDGCKWLSFSDFEGDIAYVQTTTQGIACDENGFLHGEGQIRVARSDGHTYLDQEDIYFSHGVAFAEKFLPLRSQDLVKVFAEKSFFGTATGNQKYLFHLGGNAQSRTQYFLLANMGNLHGLKLFYPVGLYVLTDQVEKFKYSEQIERYIDEASLFAKEKLSSHLNELSLFFVDDLDISLNHFYGNKGKLLSLKLDKNKRWQNNRYEAFGDWKIQKYSLNNHLFAREKEIALEKKREELQQKTLLKQTERERLRRFQALSDKNITSVNGLQNLIYRNVKYGSRYYQGMFKDKATDFSSLVEVDASSKLVFPYEMNIVNADKQALSLAAGWYWLQGEQVFEPNVYDQQGLPMSVLTVQQLYTCQEKYCAELASPLGLIRVEIGDPEWSPERAEKIIQEAQ